METALIRVMSAIKHGEGLLFGVASALQHSVWNIAGQSFLVSFSFVRYLYVHGIQPYDACANHYNARITGAVTHGTP